MWKSIAGYRVRKGAGGKGLRERERGEGGVFQWCFEYGKIWFPLGVLVVLIGVYFATTSPSLFQNAHASDC